MRTYAAIYKSSSAAALRRIRGSLPPSRPASAAGRVDIRRILHAPRLQAKLTVGAPDDAYEREADRLAAEVLRMPESEVAIERRTLPERVHRACPGCEDEALRRLPVEAEEEVLQGAQLPAQGLRITTELEMRIRALKGCGRPLPESVRAFFEPRLGRDFSPVRVHTGPRAGELARAVRARAFTVGRQVVFGDNEYAPATSAGRRLLAHELTHTVQQRAQPGALVQRLPQSDEHECEDRGPPQDEGHPLIYNYKKVPSPGLVKERSKRPAVGYAQQLLNNFLELYDNGNVDCLDDCGSDMRISEMREKFPHRLEVDCWFGDKTERATRMFQCCDGLLKVDGKIENETWPALQGAGAPRQIRRTSTIPFEERAGDTCTVTLERFIELVEAEEARYPVSDQTNTRLMITRLRKIFYGKEGWDRHLISGASHVPRPYQTRETERDRFDLPIPWAPDVTVTARDYTVTDPTTGATPEIARSKDVRLPDGTCIDLGHVFAGLDAMNYPQMVDGPGTVNISSNVDAVTWVGDLGSVQAELQFEFVRGGNTGLTSAQWQAIIDEYAPARDMLGNIDAYIIGATYDVAAQIGGKKVSEILREYYLSARGTTGGDARAHRYSTFAAAIGLIGWDGSNFSNESSWLDDYADEVNDTAALYVGANTRGWWNPARYGFALDLAGNASSRLILQKFLAELKLRIATEPP